jgi:hypothetical protein
MRQTKVWLRSFDCWREKMPNAMPGLQRLLLKKRTAAMMMQPALVRMGRTLASELRSESEVPSQRRNWLRVGYEKSMDYLHP